MKFDNSINQMFINALRNIPVKKWRVIAELKDGKIGISAWYCSMESIEELKKEAILAGHKVLRIEESTTDKKD